MNVLVLTNMFPTQQEPWFGSFVHEQVAALRALGTRIDVLSFDGREKRSAYLRAAAEVRRRVSRGRYDLVHAHYGLSGAVALSQRSIPIITTFWGSDTMYVRWQRTISWFVARATTPIFVASSNARSLGLPRATVIPSSVDIDRFRVMPRESARALLGWDRRATFILFPGNRNNRRKRPDLFDATIQMLSLDVTGVVPVALEGYTRDMVPIVMNAVDVLLMTSDVEGSPVAVKEALACGTPVVSVRVGDVPETLSGVRGCVVTEREPPQLARAVASALAISDRESPRRRAEEYSSESMVRRTLAVYDTVLRDR